MVYEINVLFLLMVLQYHVLVMIGETTLNVIVFVFLHECLFVWVFENFSLFIDYNYNISKIVFQHVVHLVAYKRATSGTTEITKKLEL